MANKQFIYDIILNVKDNVNKKLKDLNGSLDDLLDGTRLGQFKQQFTDIFGKGTTVLRGFGTAVGAVAAGIVAVGVAMFELYRANQQLNKELKQLKQLFKDVDTSTLIDAKNRIAALAEETEEDSKNITRAISNLAKVYGITLPEAIKFYEEAVIRGANANGELSGTIEEFSLAYKKAGVSLETYQNLLVKSNELGIYKDRLSDLILEINNTAIDFDKLRNTLNAPLGTNFTENLIKGIKDGSVSSIQSIGLILDKTKALGFTVKQTENIVASLYSTLGEETPIEVFNAIAKSTKNILPPLTEAQRLTKEEKDSIINLSNSLDELVNKFQPFTNLITKTKILFIEFTSSAIEGLGVLFDYFTTGDGSKTFNKIGEAAIEYGKIIETVFNKIIIVVGFLWERFGKEIVTTFKNTFEGLTGIVNSVLDIFINLYSSVNNLLNGNFKEALKDFSLIFVNTLNTIAKTVGFVVVFISDRLSVLTKAFPLVGESISGVYKTISESTKAFLEEFDKSIDKFSNKKIKPPTFNNTTPTKSDNTTQEQNTKKEDKADTDQLNTFKQASKKIALEISQDRIQAKLNELEDLKSLDETRLEDLKARQEEELKLTKELYQKQIAEANLAADEEIANKLDKNVDELTKEDRKKVIADLKAEAISSNNETAKAAQDSLLKINQAYANSASLRLQQENAIRDIKKKYDEETTQRIIGLNRTNDSILTSTLDTKIQQLQVERSQTSNLDEQIAITEKINKLESDKLAIKTKQNILDSLKKAGADVSGLEADNKAINDNIALLEKYQSIINSFTAKKPIKDRLITKQFIDELTKALLQTPFQGNIDTLLAEIKKGLLKEAEKANLTPEIVSAFFKKEFGNDLGFTDKEIKILTNAFTDVFAEATKVAKENTNKLNELTPENKDILKTLLPGLDVNNVNEATNNLQAIQTKIEELKKSISSFDGEQVQKVIEFNKEASKLGVDIATVSKENQEKIAKTAQEDAIRSANELIKTEIDKKNALNRIFKEQIDEQQIIIDQSEKNQKDRQKRATAQSISELGDNIKSFRIGDAFKNVFDILDAQFTRKRRQISETIQALKEQRDLELEIAKNEAKNAIISSVKINSNITDPKQREEEAKRLRDEAVKRFDTLAELTEKYGTSEAIIRQKAAEKGIKDLSDTEIAALIELNNSKSKINNEFNNKENEVNKSALQTRLENTAEFFEKVSVIGRSVADVVGSVFQVINANAQMQLELLQEKIAQLQEQIAGIQALIADTESNISELETRFTESTGKRRADALRLQEAELDKLLKLKAAEASLTAEKQKSEAAAKQIDKEVQERARQLALINQVVATTSIIAASAAALEKAFTRGATVWDGIAGAVAAVAAIASLYATAKSVAKFEDGGLVTGNRHSQGGVPFTVAGQSGYEMEGGEYVMSRKAVQRLGVNTLDKLNFGNESVKSKQTKFQSGGFIEQQINSNLQTSNVLESVISATQQLANRPIYVAVTDINSANNIEGNRMVSSTF